MSAQRGFVVPFAEDADIVTEPFLSPEYMDGKNQDAGLHRQMLDDLVQVDIGENRRVSVEEFMQRIKKSSLVYVEDVVYRVCSSLASSPSDDGYITGIRFADVYMKRRRELHAFFQTCVTELKALDAFIMQSESNLRKAEAIERSMVGAQVNEESKVAVQVVSIRNIPPGRAKEGDSFKLHLECSDQVIDTYPQPYESGGVFWNMMFSFQIAEGDEDLRIQLIKCGYQDEHCGDCTVVIDELSDQRKHEMTKQIWGSVKCELLLSCQWIYNKKALFQSFIREFVAKREAKVRELAEIQAEFDKMSSPFGFVRRQGGISGVISGVLHSEEHLARFIDRMMDHMKLSNYQKASQFVIATLLILSCIASYARPLFLDLVIGCYAFWSNLDARRWGLRNYTILLLVTAGSLALDCVWMVAYFGADESNGVIQREADMRSVTKLFSLFNFFWKIIVLLFFWKCRYDLAKKQQRNRRLNAAAALSGPRS